MRPSLISKVYADNTSLTYAYELETSRLQSVTDARQQQTLYTYNPDNTVATVAYSGSSNTPAVSYTYDQSYNQVSTMSDSVSGLTSYHYNAVPVSPTVGGGMLGGIVNTGSCGYTLSYGYDELGRVVSRVLDGQTTSTVYDALGRVTQVNNPLGTFNYTPYQTTSLIDHINYPNGQVVQYKYYPPAADERLQSITNLGPGSSGTISQFSYGYNAAGDITSWTQQSGPNTSAYQYGYDAADQLLQATATVNGSQSPVNAYGYRYDPAGNRTVEQINTTVTTSIHNNLNQMTSRTGGGFLTISGSLNKPGTVTVSGTSYVTGSNNTFTAVAPVITGSNNIRISATNANGHGVTDTLQVNVTGGTPISQLTYDPDGNLIYDGNNTYEWDAANRLTAINYPNGARSQFAYDGFGRRVKITETTSNGSVTSIKNLVWEGMNIAEEKNATGTITKTYSSQGVRISGSNYYYTRDHLGSIRELTDANATVQARYTYDPYGRQTQVSGTMTADFGFTGLYYHQPSSFILAVYREYSAGLGRWLSRDTLTGAEAREGPNLYRYVRNEVIDAIDPDGLGTWAFWTQNEYPQNAAFRVGAYASYTMSATEKQCCKVAQVTRYIPGANYADELSPTSWVQDGDPGNWVAGVAYADWDAPEGGGIGMRIGDNEYGYVSAGNFSFKFVAKCIRGNCAGKTLSTIYKNFHADAHKGGAFYSAWWY